MGIRRGNGTKPMRTLGAILIAMLLVMVAWILAGGGLAKAATGPGLSQPNGEKLVESPERAGNGKTNVYITDFQEANTTYTIYDTSHFTTMMKEVTVGGVTASYPSAVCTVSGAGTYSGTGGNPLFKAVTQDAGHTQDGDLVDVVVECTYLKTPSTFSADTALSRINMWDAPWQPDSFVMQGYDTHATYRIYVYYAGTDILVPDAKFIIYFNDLDTHAHSQYGWANNAESIRLESGYDENEVYLSTSTVINVESDEGYRVYEGTTGTTDGNPDDPSEWDSGVAFVANQGVQWSFRIGPSARAATALGFLATPPGNLRISKTVSGKGLNASDEFTFDVRLWDYDNKPVNGETYAGVSFNNGHATVSVSQDSPLSITGIPAGYRYAIEETNIPEYPHVLVTSTMSSGSIQSERTYDAKFTNTVINGSLSVTKEVADTKDKMAGDENRTFPMVVTLTTPDGTPVTGEIGGYEFDETGTARVQVPAEETVVIDGIPEGTKYAIEEDTSVISTLYDDTYDTKKTGTIPLTPMPQAENPA